ncbi:MAG: NAD(P)H-quinone oxidoreductase subunit 3 [Anaerolineales bacterium]|jgi:NADH:ubiquinone oxidoreductase subunit 3 (subunit A)|nr:NAD(P)H-quinone oxidoreductase subunit 3 [Anaerolineales bacterium]
MLNSWLYIGIFLVVAVVVPLVAVLLPVLIAPKKPSARKEEVYECGIETKGNVRIQFKSQYYIYALIFLVFDIEVIFLFPWAVSLDKLPLFAVLEGVIFIAILFAGLIYAMRKGALAWS